MNPRLRLSSTLRLSCFCLIGSAATAAEPRHDTVVMEQFVVEATRVDSSHPWRLFTAPGWEVLSRAQDGDTLWYAHGLALSLPLQQEIATDVTLSPPPVPYLAVLYDRPPEAQTSASKAPKAVRYRARERNYWGSHAHVVLLTNGSRAAGADTRANILNFWGSAAITSASPFLIVTNGGWLQFRLEAIRPAVPAWFIAGFIAPYGLSVRLPEPQEMVVPGALWLTDEEAEAVVKEQGRAIRPPALAPTPAAGDNPVVMDPVEVQAARRKGKPQLLPLADIFREGGPDVKNHGPAWLKEWEAEAALFVRWGLYGDPEESSAQARAFQRWVERSTREPMTEELFRRCFGFGYGEAESRLLHYLPLATSKVIELGYRSIPFWPPAMPPYSLRDATDTEVGRILGDVARMKGDEIQATDPALGAEYLRAAGETLLRAYERELHLPTPPPSFLDPANRAAAARNNLVGDPVVMPAYVVNAGRIHDSMLLAVIGLYEFDVGDVAAARLFLEAANRHQVVRPEAYLDLATLRLAAARASAGGQSLKLNLPQCVAVLQPVFTAREQAPLALAGYSLIAEVWEHASIRPTAANLAALREGVKAYPRNVAFARRAAKIYAQWGFAAEASALVRLSERFPEGSEVVHLKGMYERAAEEN